MTLWQTTGTRNDSGTGIEGEKRDKEIKKGEGSFHFFFVSSVNARASQLLFFNGDSRYLWIWSITGNFEWCVIFWSLIRAIPSRFTTSIGSMCHDLDQFSTNSSSIPLKKIPRWSMFVPFFIYIYIYRKRLELESIEELESRNQRIVTSSRN